MHKGFQRGAGRRIRTDDLLITNQLLYQLSYAGMAFEKTTTPFFARFRAGGKWLMRPSASAEGRMSYF